MTEIPVFIRIQSLFQGCSVNEHKYSSRSEFETAMELEHGHGKKSTVELDEFKVRITLHRTAMFTCPYLDSVR